MDDEFKAGQEIAKYEVRAQKLKRVTVIVCPALKWKFLNGTNIIESH